MKNKNGEQESINKSRRKLSKTGLAAPVLLSLTSKPSWAFVCTFSGAMSGNLSVERAGFVCDQGLLSSRSPGYYKNNPWPASCSPALVAGALAPNDGTKFNATFTGHPVKLIGVKHPNDYNSLSSSQLNELLNNPSIFNVLKNHDYVVWASNSSTLNASTAAFHFAAALLNSCASDLIFPFTSLQVLTAWTSQDTNFLAQLQNLQKSPDPTVEQAAQRINW